jgi:hypothetical protein
MESFDRLLNYNCCVGVVDLIGGEPLLNQSLITEILSKYENEQRIGVFQMITNGTIVPQEQTLRVMRKRGSFYAIFSNYGELSINQTKAVEALDKYDINAVVEETTDIKEENNTLWIDYGEPKHYDFTREKHQKMFDNCRDARTCATLMNGKIYLCPRIAHMDNLGLIPKDSRDSFDLMDEELQTKNLNQVKTEFLKFYEDRSYPPGCEYCDRDSGKLVERAKQVVKN